MKEKILEALKTRFEGVNEKILSRIADKLATTVTAEEQVATAVAGVTFQQVIDGEADRRATEATQTAVVNYEKKHSLKEGKPIEGANPEPPKNGDDDNKDAPEWAKALIDSNKKLSEKLETIEADKVVTSRKQKLDEIVKELPENLQKPYGRISLNAFSDDEFEAFLTEAQAEVKAIADDYSSQGVVFNPPKGGGGNLKKEATKEEAAEVLNALI